MAYVIGCGLLIVVLMGLAWHLVRQRDLTKMFTLEAALGRAEARLNRLDVTTLRMETPREQAPSPLTVRPRGADILICYEDFSARVEWSLLHAVHARAKAAKGDLVLHDAARPQVALYLPAKFVPELRARLTRILYAYTETHGRPALHVVKEKS